MSTLPGRIQPGQAPECAADNAPTAHIETMVNSASPYAHADMQPVTINTLRAAAKRSESFACLTCYDYTTATWLQRAGVPVLLVGDTAAEMILGFHGTIHAPLDFLITITAAVKRGAPHSHVMADMPFMSYQADDAEAMRNAGRFLTEGNADSVKFEVDGTYVALVEKMARAGIPVVAHIGSRPQLVKKRGGYRSAGRTAEEARDLVESAVSLEQAGAAMLLIEAVPNDVSKAIVERTTIPVIGCGAGQACHGQIVVLHDVLGMSEWQPPFAPPLSQTGEMIAQTATQWKNRVIKRSLGKHPYEMSDEERRQFNELIS